MKVGVVLSDDKGINGEVCAHFGQCQYFFLVDIDSEKKEILGSRVVPNTAQHGGGACHAVDEILKHQITHIIAGGMGMGAQNKFAQAGVTVFGYCGKVQDALVEFINNTLGGIEACQKPSGDCHRPE